MSIAPFQRLQLLRIGAAVTLVLAAVAPAWAEETPAVALLAPAPDSEVIAKRPEIRIGLASVPPWEAMLVLLDNADITALLEPRDDGFSYNPVQILGAGAHQLSVTLLLADGRQLEQSFAFASRHSETLLEAYSINQLSVEFEGAAVPADAPLAPDTKVEANLQHDSRIGQPGWQYSLTTNARYFDQNEPALAPQSKGLDLANMTLSARYQQRELGLSADVGDVQVDQSPYTLSGLARRGAVVGAQYGSGQIQAFNLRSAQEYGFSHGLGIGGDRDTHISGASAGLRVLDDRLALSALYASGGEQGSSFGIGTLPEQRRGSIAGLSLDAKLWPDLLQAELDLGWSDYDPDTSDEFDAERDHAILGGLSGGYGRYRYQARYERLGRDYRVIGNDGLLPDREGGLLRVDADFDGHGIYAAYSRYRDNLDDDPLFARLLSASAELDYRFNRNPNLPLGLNYRRDTLRSRDEPVNTAPIKVATDTITGNLSYQRGAWGYGLQGYFSRRDDREQDSGDTNTTGISLFPSYRTQLLAVAPSFGYNRLYLPDSELHLDNFTLNLDVRGQTPGQRFDYALAATYLNQQNSDGLAESEQVQGNFLVSYRLLPQRPKGLDPAVGVLGRFQRDLRGFGPGDDFSLMLVLTSGLQASF